MLRGLWALAVLIVSTTILGGASIVVSLVKRENEFTGWALRTWSRIMLAATGARVEYDGLEQFRADLPYVFISNHVSNVDIWALARELPPSARFVAKQELRKVPVLGLTMASTGFVFVDRSNRARAIRSLERAAERIRGGRPVVMFAEGTRSRDGRLQPFKKGPFHLALKAGVPIVPAAISGSWGILKPRSLAVTPGTVRVRFFEPIDVAPWQPDDVNGLMGTVHAVIRRELELTEDRTR